MRRSSSDSPAVRRMRARVAALAPSVLVLMSGIAGCELLTPDAPESNQVLDGPVEGMTPGQVRLHILGDEEFARRFAISDGLGPIFVATSCEQCHVGDGKGHPSFNLQRFGRSTPDGFDPMARFGGAQLQNRAIPGHEAESVPVGATGLSTFTPPAVTGLGYLDEVDDATLVALADPDDRNGDGISGRLQLHEPSEIIRTVLDLEGQSRPDPEAHGTMVEGKYIGRFGKKALTVNLLHQTVGAYHEDMGVTSDLLPEDLFNHRQGGRTSDDVPDPEVGSSTVANVVFYLKTLRVPERRNQDDPAVVAGEQLFETIGCAACHLPTLRTGRSEVSVLSEVEFHPYTDLLLHDMGPELDDGYTEGHALTSEWRTPPLWGIGLQQDFQGGDVFLLHDGRARSLRQAIEFHGGEGAASRAAFRALSNDLQAQLLRFLESL